MSETSPDWAGPVHWRDTEPIALADPEPVGRAALAVALRLLETDLRAQAAPLAGARPDGWHAGKHAGLIYAAERVAGLAEGLEQ